MEFPTGYVFLSRRVFGSTLSAPSKANPKMIDERVRMARGQIASAALASFSQSSGLILRVAVMDRFVMDAIVASVAKRTQWTEWNSTGKSTANATRYVSLHF